MRILHVIGSIDPAEGGPPVIATRLAAAQAGLGHQVHLASYDTPDSRTDWAHITNVAPGADQVTMHFLPPVTRGEALFGSNARQLARRLMPEIDAVHIHSVWRKINVVTADEARRNNVPYMVLLNGTLDPWSLSQKSLKKKIALAMSIRKMLNGAFALHLGNTTERELIEPLKLTAPGVIIPNGMFLEEIEPLPEPGTFRATHPDLGDAPFILFMSRLHYKKGLDYLADSFVLFSKTNPDAHLVVAGPDGGARADFVERIERANVQDRVHIVGPIYGDAKRGAMVDCECFCLPSRQEGFSVAIGEAMAFCKPVVTTEGAHRPDVAEANAGLVVPLENQAIADALLTVMSDPTLRATMAANGRALTEQRYTWPIIAAQTIKAYENAISSPPGNSIDPNKAGAA